MITNIDLPIEVRRLNALATACKNAASDDFKKLWYDKLIELAKQYKLMDYVMRKLVH
jgi:hypothetical protein